MVLYLHKEMYLETTALRFIAKTQGRHVAERIRLQQIKARNEEITAKWRKRRWSRRPDKPWLITPNWMWYVTDGCSNVKLQAYVNSHKNGGHNWWCCSRRDVYFSDLNGRKWWGVHLAADWGNNLFSNDVVRCKKLKQTA